MTGFAIVCDARAGEGLGIHTLVLVDRAKTKSLWWTSDSPCLAIRYRQEGAARFAARRLRHNRPRVVPFSEAASILRQQSAEILHCEAMADCDRGWEDHKDYFGAQA